jgi:hypothetical protein
METLLHFVLDKDPSPGVSLSSLDLTSWFWEEHVTQKWIT